MYQQLAEEKKCCIAVPLSALKEDQVNSKKISLDLTVVILHDGKTWRAFHDVCPHMGGPLSQGWLCSKTNALVCPWHGYRYSKTSLSLLENPNEKIWIQPLAAGKMDQYKTPHYKFREFPCEIIQNELVIDVPKFL
ncbi:MAG: Rieske (2Fe-2S) protein [Candidatus Omnitrophica bacterium]|nr:Rieske (2Fe-2S) protein [Candidatus Omnitrophota bacterium]